MIAARPPRWKERLETFGRALARLEEAVNESKTSGLSQLARDGLIQRFEFTWELAWKTLADYLADMGFDMSGVGPRQVFRVAAEAGVIGDVEGWMQTVDARNISSHAYDRARAETISERISWQFLALMQSLHSQLRKEATHG